MLFSGLAGSGAVSFIRHLFFHAFAQLLVFVLCSAIFVLGLINFALVCGVVHVQVFVLQLGVEELLFLAVNFLISFRLFIIVILLGSVSGGLGVMLFLFMVFLILVLRRLAGLEPIVFVVSVSPVAVVPVEILMHLSCYWVRQEPYITQAQVDLINKDILIYPPAFNQLKIWKTLPFKCTFSFFDFFKVCCSKIFLLKFNTVFLFYKKKSFF